MGKQRKRENHCDRKIAYKRNLILRRGNKYELERFNERYGR